MYQNAAESRNDVKMTYCKLFQISFTQKDLHLPFFKLFFGTQITVIQLHAAPKRQQNAHIVNKSSSRLNPDLCELITGSF